VTEPLIEGAESQIDCAESFIEGAESEDDVVESGDNTESESEGKLHIKAQSCV